MSEYIPKSALVAEIERLGEVQPLNEFQPKEQNKIDWLSGKLFAINSLRVFLDTLEVKEVDLEKELDSMITPELKFHKALPSLFDVAKHFFELGLSTQHSSINIPNIDNILEESGIDPYSKEAKIFKESYYMVLEKLKEQKGEEL